MDFPGPALFRVNETEVPDTSNYILKWYEEVSATDISRVYLTVIDDSTRDVANKISKTEYILDSGANRRFFNSTINLHDFKTNMHLMYLSDNRSVPSIGTGDYGCLHDILVVPSLYVNLISISKLCNDYDFLTLFDKKRALILDRSFLYTTMLEHATVVAASFRSDNLYHTSGLSPLLHEKYHSRANALKSTSGSSRAKYRTTTAGLNPLEVLHVRLGHASEDLIKWIVKSGVCDGLDYTYDQIKPVWRVVWSIFRYHRLWPLVRTVSSSTSRSISFTSIGKVAAGTSTPHYSSINVLPRHLLIISSVNPTSSRLSRSSYVTIILIKMRILHSGFDSLVLDKHFNDVLVKKNIRLRTSAPYKHQQNLA
jgi:hypothetical protein